MATGLISPIAFILQAFSDQGIVGAGYQIATYKAGSTTPIATYTDSTLTVANANPIVLRSNGRLPQSVWAPAGSLIKMVLMDNVGNTIAGGTIDNLPMINDFSSSLYPETPQEETAGVTIVNQLYPPGDVRRYGAQVDGSTNDTAAVTAAISQAKAGGSGVYFPAGTCVAKATLSGLCAGIVIHGEGQTLSVVKAISTTDDVFTTASGAQIFGIVMEKMQIVGQTSATAGNGINFTTGLLDPPFNVIMRDLYVNGVGGRGIYDQAGIFDSRCDNVMIGNTGSHNFDLLGDNTLLLTNCYAFGGIPGNGTAGYRIHGGSPTLLACNGINAGDSWGIFSDNMADDGVIQYCSPTFIESNIESFAKVGVRNKQGGITVLKSTFLAHAPDVVAFDCTPANTSTLSSLDNDSSFTNTASPIVVNFTAGLSIGATSATLSTPWALTTGVWQVQVSDGEIRGMTLTNGATTCTWTGAMTGTSTQFASTLNAWRFGFPVHVTTNSGNPFSSVMSPAGNIQFTWWDEVQSVAVSMSTIRAASVASNRYGVGIYDTINTGITKVTQEVQTSELVAYGTTVTPNWAAGNIHKITVTNGTGFTIAVPTGYVDGQIGTYWISNISGGTLGSVTFSGFYKLAGSWTSPANANNRSITFRYDLAQNSFYEISRTAADVAN